MKPVIHILFLAIALLFCDITIKASTEDSLRNVIANTDGVEKLRAISNLMALKDGDKDAIDYVIMLEEEARKQDHEFFIAHALTIKAALYGTDSYDNNEKFYSASNEAMAYNLEKNFLKNYFFLYKNVIAMHLFEGYYETAFLKISLMLEEAKKFNDIFGEISVYDAMGDAYSAEKQHQKALEAYQKAYSLYSIHFSESLPLRMETGSKIVINAYDSGDMPLTILYCDSIMQLIEEFDSTKTFIMENYSAGSFKNLFYAFYALAYISTGREKEATEAMDMALKYSEDEFRYDHREKFHTLCADYYYKKGEYKTALEYIGKLEKQQTYVIPAGDILMIKSKILAATRNFEDAYKTEREYRELTDSLNQKKLSQRISELRTIHEVEKLEFKAEQEKLENANLRLLIFGLMIIVMILTGTISTIINNLNKIKRKNRVLYQSMLSQEALEEEFKRKEEALRMSLVSDNETSDDEDDRLYLRLKELMKDEKNYTDPNISRRALAAKLVTNERYLFETIKKHLNLSFAEYINLLRLDYAREILSKKNNEMTLEDIAIMSGFKTRQTFHRLFRDRYGLTPSEFSGFLNKGFNLIN